MKKLFSISLALAIIFILLAGIAVAGQIRDGTAPVFAQHSITALIPPGPSIFTSPAVMISPAVDIAIVTTTSPQPAFAKGSWLKFMTTPLLEVTHPRVFPIIASEWPTVINGKGSSIGMSEVIHPLLCYTELEWERMPLIAASKGPVNQTTGMASC